ncbi:helicase-related protein [Bordetella pertussis]|uniref:helicase-related protein n=1 Tax=Bordetella pertussis TaxID=520 RepID=UPI001E2BB598|nr:helicase-related protein [Bordetella pertussis]
MSDEAAAAPAKGGRERSAGDEERDLIDAIVDAVDECARHGPGDVLVFLPGEREIRESAEALRKRHPVGTEVLPLYARLSQAEQEQIFHPRGNARRVVLATNVAETSLTVPGIRFVVDSGLARVKRYSWRNKVEQLRIEPVSRASGQPARRPLRPDRARACASASTTRPISTPARRSPTRRVLRSFAGVGRSCA